MPKPIKYYRPSFTSKEITSLTIYLRKHIEEREAKNLLKKLIPFQAKIDNGILSPSFESVPKESLLESIGGVNPKTLSPSLASGIAAYNKYIQYPESCTLPEIESAREYAYMNDLMDQDEMVAYEREQFDAVNPSNLDNHSNKEYK